MAGEWTPVSETPLPPEWTPVSETPLNTTARGVAKNVAAGGTDIGANVVNIASNPSGNIIGKPLATAAVFLHDLIAPWFGGERFPDPVRNALLNDTVPQPGTRMVGAIGDAVGINAAAVPATPAEQVVRKVTGAAGTAAALGPAGIAAPAAGGAGAIVGHVAAEAAPDWAKPMAELTGNVAGAGTVAGVDAGVRGVRGQSGGVAPEVAGLAKTARDVYDINVRAPQMSESSVVRLADSQSRNLPFSGAAKQDRELHQSFNRALSRVIGEDEPLVNSDVMAKAAPRIGGVFDDVAKKTTLDADQTFLTDFGTIQNESRLAPLGEGGHQSINGLLNTIIDAAAKGNGKISGADYQTLTRTGAPLDRAMKAADPNTAFYASKIREALDDALERAAPPEEVARLQTARKQFRAMKTIEDLVEKSPDGNLSPALLMGQVRAASAKYDSSTGGMAYTGGGPLGDLARIGQRFLKEPPNSGTPDRMMVNAAVGGAVGSGGLTNSLWRAGMVPVMLTANKLLGGYVRGQGLADRMIDSSLNGPRPLTSPLYGAVASQLEADRLRQMRD